LAKTTKIFLTFGSFGHSVFALPLDNRQKQKGKHMTIPAKIFIISIFAIYSASMIVLGANIL